MSIILKQNPTDWFILVPTHFQGSDTERRALDIYIKLLRAADSIASQALAPVQELGLTVTQFGVLEALWHLGPMTLSELANKHLKSANNLTVVVDNLERMSLARRERSTTDRRVIYVHLTDDGEALIRQAFPPHVASVVQLMSVLNEAEQEILSGLLRRLGTQDKEKREN
jgi:MarR family transcriptional regulator, 2-MHQ and catechol-resistance regulon repressor